MSLGGAWAACSSYSGNASGPRTAKVVINEYNYSAGYVELKVLDRSILAQTNQLDGWVLSIHSKNRSTDYSVKAALSSQTCPGQSDYIRIDAGSLGTDANVILWSNAAKTQEVDYFRVGQKSYPTYQKTTCFDASELPAVSNTTFFQSELIRNASRKNISRTPDGIGKWLITPYSGQNQGTLCESNVSTLTLRQVLSAPASATVPVGGTVSLRLTVALDSTSDTQTAVVVTDLLPEGLLYQNHTASRGTYDQVSGLWTVGTVNPGESVTLDIQARVARVGSLRNVATVRSVDFPVGSVSPVELVIMAMQPLQLTLIATPAAVPPNGGGGIRADS